MKQKLGHWVDGWMDGWKDGRKDGNAGLRFAYSNKKWFIKKYSQLLLYLLNLDRL